MNFCYRVAGARTAMVAYLKTNVFSILCRAIAVYFVWAFHLHVGFPPTAPLTSTGIIYLFLFVFFFVLPFAQRLRLGRFIEFEAKVEQVRADVKEVRTETRELVSTISTVANAISASMNQNVVVNVPSLDEALAARAEMSAVLPQSSEKPESEWDISELSGASDSDLHYVLARLRMDLERELRRILGKRTRFDKPGAMQGKFLSARSLFRQLGKTIERYKHMQSSFDYILEVCNAAIHGQRVPERVAHEAIDMGMRILGELKNEDTG